MYPDLNHLSHPRNILEAGIETDARGKQTKEKKSTKRRFY